MRKMFLVNPDEYQSLKKTSLPQTLVSNDASDVKLAKYQDAFVRKRDAGKIKENQGWENLSTRLKPILSGPQSEMQEMLNQFPTDRQNNAQFILSILSRLPKVVLTPKRLLIDGVPMEDSMVDVIDDIMRNDVKGIESLIQVLRLKKRAEPPQLVSLDSTSMTDPSSLSSTIVAIPEGAEKGFDASRIGDIPPTAFSGIGLAKTSTPSKIPTPKRKTPIKTKQLEEFTGKARSPKVKRSPIKLRSHSDQPSKEQNVKGANFWISY